MKQLQSVNCTGPSEADNVLTGMSQQQVGLLFSGSKKLTQIGLSTLGAQVPGPVQLAEPPLRPTFRSN